MLELLKVTTQGRLRVISLVITLVLEQKIIQERSLETMLVELSEVVTIQEIIHVISKVHVYLIMLVITHVDLLETTVVI